MDRHSALEHSTDWPGLDPIAGKVVSPGEIYQHLVDHAGKYASEMPRIQYLTRLFFHFGGPLAFQQLIDAFSAMCHTKEIDIATVGGRIRALGRISLANPLEQRALLVEPNSERTRQQQHAVVQGHLQPERTALGEMMACCYESLHAGVSRDKGSLASGKHRVYVRKGTSI